MEMRLLNELEDIVMTRERVICTCVCIFTKCLMLQVNDAAGSVFTPPKKVMAKKPHRQRLLLLGYTCTAGDPKFLQLKPHLKLHRVPRPFPSGSLLSTRMAAPARRHINTTNTSGFHISHNALKSVTFWRISLCGILHIIMYGYITPKNR